MNLLPTVDNIFEIHGDIHGGSRGCLVAIDHGLLPFAPRRTFWVTGATCLRGQHAHKNECQALFCLSGSCRIEASDGEKTVNNDLIPDGVGLYAPRGLWLNIWHSKDDCNTLLVFSNSEYNQDDYVGSWDEFMEFRKCGK